MPIGRISPALSALALRTASSCVPTSGLRVPRPSQVARSGRATPLTPNRVRCVARPKSADAAENLRLSVHASRVVGGWMPAINYRLPRGPCWYSVARLAAETIVRDCSLSEVWCPVCWRSVSARSYAFDMLPLKARLPDVHSESWSEKFCLRASFLTNR